MDTVTPASRGFFATFRPLIVIISLVLAATAALTLRDSMLSTAHWWRTMQYFMAGFFLVFAGLKLLDLPGFAKGYAKYDLLASRLKAYGYVYPFLELGLGLAYLTQFQMPAVHLATFVLMTFSGIGVVLKLAKRERFECACLGTMIKVPLTKITLVEDFGMAAMALVMLLG